MWRKNKMHLVGNVSIRSLLFVCQASLLLLINNSFGADFFKGKWKGIKVDGKNFATTNVIGFVASGPDASGYITLYAKPFSGDSAPIFTTRLKGVWLQGWIVPAGEAVKGFTITSGADTIHLFAKATGGSTGEILKAKWKGVGVDSIEAGAGNVIHSFIATPADVNGYVYLGFGEGPFASEFLGWDCILQNGAAYVSWATEVELSTYKWVVERREQSEDYATMYEEIGSSGGKDYLYVDSTLKAGVKEERVYWYRLIRVSGNSKECYGEKEIRIRRSITPGLCIIPDPFNKVTTIHYSVPEGAGSLRIRIYDKSGGLVRSLMDGARKTGEYMVNWEGVDDMGKEMKNGVYFVRFELELKNNKNFSETRKVVLMR